MRWHEALSGWFQLVNGRFRPVPEGRWRRLTAIVCTVIGDASLRTARPTPHLRDSWVAPGRLVRAASVGVGRESRAEPDANRPCSDQAQAPPVRMALNFSQFVGAFGKPSG